MIPSQLPLIIQNLQDAVYKNAHVQEHFQLSPCKISNVIEKSWVDTPENMKIKLTGNLHALFLRLKNHGVKIAICTSDSRLVMKRKRFVCFLILMNDVFRDGTEQFLSREKLTHFVDMAVCGDDVGGKPKPGKICLN